MDSWEPSQWRNWLLGLLMVLFVLAAYQPVWRAGFIWDDDVYVTENKLLTAPDGLSRIWFSKDSPSQYFPLVYTAFRFERGLWGLSPVGYHWVNLLLHAANALLLWQVLKRLGVRGAWIGACLFALHPVQVETVAWVTERKNVMSLLFYLSSLLTWLRFVEGRDKPLWRQYWLALGCMALALFSKTTACTLPAALLLVLWLRREPISRARLAQIAPFVGLGLCMGLVTMWWERHHIGTSGGVFGIGLLDRVLIASRAVWFYLWKLVWPANLAFSYPRWVSPTLGFIMLYTFRYTFVADHYQYVACIGPVAMAGAGIAMLVQRVAGDGRRFAGMAIYAVVLAVLAGLTWHQAGAYRDVESLWRDTIVKNPDSWLAHGNLGRRLMRKGLFDEAMAQYREALRVNPNDVDSLVNVGNALFGKGQHDLAMDYYERALQLNPGNPEAHVNLAVILANRGRKAEAIEHNRKALQLNPKHLTAQVNLAVMLASEGLDEEAMEHYRAALAINADQPLTHINMAIALEAVGRSAEAAAHYRIAAANVNRHAAALAEQGRQQEAAAQYTEAIRMIPNNAEAHCGLGILLARMGRAGEAREHFAEALRLKPDYDEAARHLRALPPGP